MRCTQEHCSRSPASEIARTFVAAVTQGCKLPICDDIARHLLITVFASTLEEHANDNIASPLPML